MADSTLDPENMPEPDRQLGKGHGTNRLGPSDISDTGSDMQPGVHAVDENMLGLDRGTNEDADSHNIDVRGDSDAPGTGESSTAGRNADVDIAGDINVDRIEEIDAGDNEGMEEVDQPPRRQPSARPPSQGRNVS
jgi:hypothetical protein